MKGACSRVFTDCGSGYIKLLLTGGTLCLATLMPTAAESAQVGIGISTSGNSVYLPIRLEEFMLEPMYYTSRDERGYPDGSGFYELEETTVAGMGFFALSTHGDAAKIDTYWGLRFGYMSKYTENVFLDVNGNVATVQDDESSVIFQPTVGVQYFFALRFSLSADVSYMFRNGSVDTIYNGQSYTPYDSNFFGTIAKVLVRGYFN